MNSAAEIADLLLDGRRFIALSHTNPDGDALGAVLGIAHALRRLGKECVAYNQDAAPYFLRYLPGVGDLRREWPGHDGVDAILVLDCGDFYRVGKILEMIQNAPRVVNIDHHASNPMFGEWNFVDESASSTSEMVYRILRAADFVFDADTATCLYTGVFSDTRAFHNANSSPDAYRICGEMVAAGADPVRVARHLYIEQRPEAIRLMAAALTTLAIEDDGRIAGVAVTREMTERAGAAQDAFEGLVDIPRSIIGVEGAYVVREVAGSDGKARIKGSIRTTERIDATVVTAQFGGGGHRRAAGFTTEGELGDIRDRLVAALREQLGAS